MYKGPFEHMASVMLHTGLSTPALLEVYSNPSLGITMPGQPSPMALHFSPWHEAPL